MLLLQTPWTPSTIEKGAGSALMQIRGTMIGDTPALALLPHADGSEHEATSEKEITDALGVVARAHNLYLGASAYVVVGGEAVPRTIGYVVGPEGDVLLRNAKILPDTVEGYTDTIADTFKPAELSVARTPLGQIGLLCGEDMLGLHIVRTQTVRGAEIILNPSRERSDHLLRARLLARTARAYENLCFVAMASASMVTVNGSKARQPAVTGLFPHVGKPIVVKSDESVLKTNIDLEGLRRRRQQPFINFPAIVRMNLYAPGYLKEASKPRSSPSSRNEWIVEGNKRVATQVAPPRADIINNYSAMMCQHVVHQSSKPEELGPKRQKNLDDAFDLVRNYGARAPNLKLVVFPEFFLTGPVSPLGHKLGHIADKIGVSFAGPEMDQIAAFAQECNAYVCGGVFEYDPEWPNRFFNTAFIYDDKGKLIHRYRKIHCGDAMGFLPDTTPGSVYDQYVQKYGYEDLFPVVDTPIGKLATVICFDNNFGETHRAMTQRGAEIIIHPTSEPHGAHRTGWDSARLMRGFENTAYVLTCGHGGEYFLPGRVVPSSRARGYSKIVNFDGSIQAEADTSGQAPLSGSIDLRALRRARADIQANVVLWDDPVVYATEYAKSPRGLPNNIWPDDPMGNPYYGGAEIKKVVTDYIKEGIFVAPEKEQSSASPK